MSFEPFQNFVQKAINRHGISRETEAALICQNFRNLIPELFKGKETPEKFIKPAYFRNETLVIKVENPAWGQEVVMRKQQIIDKINQKLNKQVIKKLRTQIFS